MSYVEHYFENLLLYGKDPDNSNRQYLTQAERDAVEECAEYIRFSGDYVQPIRCGECEHWIQDTGFCTVMRGFCGDSNFYCASGKGRS